MKETSSYSILTPFCSKMNKVGMLKFKENIYKKHREFSQCFLVLFFIFATIFFIYFEVELSTLAVSSSIETKLKPSFNLTSK